MGNRAAASRLSESVQGVGNGVSVHACHFEQVALSPMLAQLGLEEDCLPPAQAATVPAFLACDQRIEGMGEG